MIVSLIGMSNAGKTYWSKQLEADGFVRYGVDDAIDEWLLQSYQIGSRAWEAECLRREREILLNILQEVERDRGSNHVVIDTPGSIIHHERDILEALRDHTVRVYLEISAEAEAQMMERYFQFPKAVVWAEHFAPYPDETTEQSIRRCYPELLASRTARYREMADVIIPYHVHRNSAWTTDDFLYALLQHKQHVPAGELF